MGRRISMPTREELVASLGERYRAAPRAEKSTILDEFVAVTGYHRKHAIRLLKQGMASGRRGGRARERVYDEAVRDTLIIIWEAADRICGKRLKAVLPDLLSSMQQHGHISLAGQLREKLLTVSAATIDRLLTPVRAKARGKRKRTHPNHIRRKVSVRTFADWHDPVPGYFEMDFVVHNGGNPAGNCVHSLVLTDVSSGWTESLALAARQQALVAEGLTVVRAQLPMPLLGIDTDNDSAFMNDTVYEYCRKHEIEFTRSRAYHKNDQAWIEQKNGAIVRRFVGYDRLAGMVATQCLARLYQATRLYVNFFQPSFKLLSKTRQGARVTKKYHAPATPCERLLRSTHVRFDAKQFLRKQRDELDPVKLLHGIRELQKIIAGLAVTNPRKSPPSTKNLNQFLHELPYLWHEGEVRATHRQRSAAPRHWRTRADPFESVWPEILGWLQDQPDASGKSLFDRLQSKYPGRFAPGQVRTLQRRVRGWRQTMARELVYGSCQATPSASAPTPEGINKGARTE